LLLPKQFTVLFEDASPQSCVFILPFITQKVGVVQSHAFPFRAFFIQFLQPIIAGLYVSTLKKLDVQPLEPLPSILFPII